MNFDGDGAVEFDEETSRTSIAWMVRLHLWANNPLQEDGQ